jgi:uncharacterized protein with gpF-like domain
MPDQRLLLRAWLLSLDRFELRLRLAQARNRNAFIKEAAEAFDQNGTVPGWLNERHRRRIAATLTEHYEAVIPHFATMARRQIKSRQVERKQSSTFLAHMHEWIAREALKKARLIAATDAQDVRDAVEDGVTEGLGSEAIARNIRKVTSLTTYRAATVARTETHAAATYGSVESVREAEQELGVRMLKQWLPTTDDRTRPDHAAMADSDPIPLDEKFTVGGSTMDRPGDPSAPPEQTVNCRCALIYVEAE